MASSPSSALPAPTADGPGAARFPHLRNRGSCDGRHRRVARRWPWWQWPHLLSLDASAVAVTWLWWWSDRRSVHLPASRFAILGLCVWAIYVADRLADAAKEGVDNLPTDRHVFHAIHRRPLEVALFATLVTLGWLASSSLPPWQFLGGLGLLGLVALYYWAIHHAPRAFRRVRRRIPKEAVVGGLFALGTSFLLVGTAGVRTTAMLFQATVFGALCFLNCALITCWEQGGGGEQDQASMLRGFPRTVARLRSFALGLGFTSLLAAFTSAGIELLPVVLSAGALYALDFYHESIDPGALRVLADLALLTPWLVAASL